VKKLFSKSKIILLAILIIATFLRLYKLSSDPPSLFGDEVDLGYQAYSILKTGRDYQGNFMPIHFHSLAEWRTPLYLYSAVPTVTLWGITPLGVRFPAALFGILIVLALYLFVKELTKNEKYSLLAAGLIAINPWALQYSRAGFEVTEMLFFLIMGLWLFLLSLKKPKLLWLSVAFLVLTPWIYSTAKFFTPLLLIFLFILYRKEVLSISLKYLVFAAIAGIIVGVPITYSSLFGGGAQRFSYISIFADPTTDASIGDARQMQARIRGETGAGLTPTFIDKIVYNKFTFWGDNFIKNYLSAYSAQFLFIKGDPDPRQSVGTGEFYRIEVVALIFGLIFFFSAKKFDLKTKFLIGFLIIVSAVPAALTVDGGNHATRLILLLPLLIFMISVGWIYIVDILHVKLKTTLIGLIAFAYLVSGFLYLHEYYTSYQWNSERWWHYGWGQALTEIKSIDPNYNRVFISMSGEPAWIFFAGYYQYPPADWQKNFPIGNDVEIPGFGKISHINKYYFGSPISSVQIYGLGKYIDSKTIYLANATEMGANLIMEPGRVPDGLKLIKAIPFPSGEPAFYIFTGTK
jgi:4-amino-4-deoxy-L-arabinose transferase-like glycosyltransferase